MDPLRDAMKQARKSIEQLDGKQYKATRALWDVLTFMLLESDGSLMPPGGKAIPMHVLQEMMKNKDSKIADSTDLPTKIDKSYL